MSTFGERFKELKDESGKMLKDLSDELGVSCPTLSYYMKDREPSYKVLCKIADYFNVSADYLTGNSNYRTHEAERLTQALSAKSNIDDAQQSNNPKVSHSCTRLYESLSNIAELETATDKLVDVWEMVSLLLDGVENYCEFLGKDRRPNYPLDEAKAAMDALTDAKVKAFKRVKKMLSDLIRDDEADKKLKERVSFSTSVKISAPILENLDNAGSLEE